MSRPIVPLCLSFSATSTVYRVYARWTQQAERGPSGLRPQERRWGLAERWAEQCRAFALPAAIFTGPQFDFAVIVVRPDFDGLTSDLDLDLNLNRSSVQSSHFDLFLESLYEYKISRICEDSKQRPMFAL